jgi:hypothetical protein
MTSSESCSIYITGIESCRFKAAMILPAGWLTQALHPLHPFSLRRRGRGLSWKDRTFE